jgi:hypothetical protein
LGHIKDVHGTSSMVAAGLANWVDSLGRCCFRATNAKEA